MNRPMIAAGFMSVLLVIYLAFAFNYAWILVTDRSPLANAMGYALIVLPLLGTWGLVAELRFGFASSALGKKARSIRGDADRVFLYPERSSRSSERTGCVSRVCQRCGRQSCAVAGVDAPGYGV